MRAGAIMLALFLCITCCPSYAASADGTQDNVREKPEFSATMIMEEKRAVTRARIFCAKGKQRMEEIGEGKDGVVITRYDKELVWMLTATDREYMEIPLDEARLNPLLADKTIIKHERMFRESVDGRPAVKVKVTVKYKDGARESMYIWQAGGIEFPLKAQALDGSWCYTLTDLELKKQNPAIFEVPRGYRSAASADDWEGDSGSLASHQESCGPDRDDGTSIIPELPDSM